MAEILNYCMTARVKWFKVNQLKLNPDNMKVTIG